MIAFSRPAAFFLLFLIPLLPLLRRLGLFRRPSLVAVLADWGDEIKCTASKARGALHSLSDLLVLLCYVCTVIAAAGPITKNQEKVYQSLGASIMFIADTSPSMAAKDMDGLTRLDAAKKAIKELAQKTGGAALGLTAMASEAAVVVPPTADRGTFLSRLDSLSPGYMGEGTALGTALATACCHLSKSSSPRKYCVLVTDGENNAGFVSVQTAARLLIKQNIRLYVLGVGKDGIAPLEYTDPQTGKSYSGTFQSHFDPSDLMEAAEAGGGRYFYVQGAKELSAILAEVSRDVTLTQSYFLRQEINDNSAKPILFAVAFAFAALFLKRLILKEAM